MVKWKLYNKSKEVFVRDGERVHETKPYIVDCWRRAGWDVSGIWRLEVSVQDCAQFEWNGRRLDLSVLSEYEQIWQVFKGLYSKRFVVRVNEGHVCRKNDARVFLVNLLCGDKVQKAKPKSCRESAEGVAQLRRIAAALSAPSSLLSAKIFAALADAGAAVVEEFGLERYCERVFGTDWMSLCQEVYADAGDGVVDASPVGVEARLGH